MSPRAASPRCCLPFPNMAQLGWEQGPPEHPGMHRMLSLCQTDHCAARRGDGQAVMGRG